MRMRFEAVCLLACAAFCRAATLDVPRLPESAFADREASADAALPDRWSMLRVTVRGADTPEESVKAVFAPDGARVIVR